MKFSTSFDYRRIEDKRVCKTCGACHNVFMFDDHPITKDGEILQCVKCEPEKETPNNATKS